MSMKKTLGCLLALALALNAGLALGAAEFNAPGETPICKETVHLTLGIQENIRIEDYETNTQTRLLEEYGNFDLEFVVMPSTDYVTKLNLMVMAGGAELPDILLANPGDAMVYQWAQEGVILPLTAYYGDAGISHWLHEAMDRLGFDFTSQIVSPDGELYGIPTLNQSYGNEYPDKLYYYAPWLQALGLEEPGTPEAFKALLQAVVTSDLNGNGRADEIGMAGASTNKQWLKWLMNAYVYAGDSNYFTVADGVVDAAYTTEAWKQGLHYVRSLFAEGLIPMETLTQDGNQFNAMVNAQDLSVFSFVSISPSMINADNPARGEYVGLAPLKGPEGVRFASYLPSTASISFMITANCKEPEAAFRLGDLLVREDFSIMTRWGAEGVNWDYAKNVKGVEAYVPNVEGWPVYLVAYDDNGFWGGSAVSNASWRQAGPFIRQYAIANGSGKNADTLTPFTVNTNACYTLYQEGGWNPAEVIPKLVFNVEENDQVNEPLATLKSYVEEKTSNFVAGNLDIDANWDAYLAELEAIGLRSVLETVQTVYDRMYK